MAHFYISQILYLKGLTYKELVEALNTDINLLLQIIYQGALLPGTCLYWQNCTGSLQAYAYFLSQLTVPIFVTFSCTDIQQYDLQQYLPWFIDYLIGEDRACQQIVQLNIQNYPYIIIYYLDLCFQVFLKYIVCLQLRITDYWICYKQQYHSSGYIYYLFQTESGPLLDLSIDEQQVIFTIYQGQQIMAQNPDQLYLLDTCNPASLALSDIINTSDQFTAFLIYLQLYSTYYLGYYLQTKNRETIPYYQFFYLQLLT